jgi:hypothetical protein
MAAKSFAIFSSECGDLDQAQHIEGSIDSLRSAKSGVEDYAGYDEYKGHTFFIFEVVATGVPNAITWDNE